MANKRKVPKNLSYDVKAEVTKLHEATKKTSAGTKNRQRLFTNEFRKGDRVIVFRVKGSPDGNTYIGPAVITQITPYSCMVAAANINEEEEGPLFQINHPRDIRKENAWEDLRHKLLLNTARLSSNIRELALEEVRLEVVKLRDSPVLNMQTKQVLKYLDQWIDTKKGKNDRRTKD